MEGRERGDGSGIKGGSGQGGLIREVDERTAEGKWKRWQDGGESCGVPGYERKNVEGNVRGGKW